MTPTIIHNREVAKFSGRGLYLSPSPVHGNGIYLTQGGFIGISKVLQFASKNSGLIKDGVSSIAQAVSAISDLKKASNDAQKLKEIREIKKKQEEKTIKLTDEEQELINNAIASAKSGSSLKRF
jgi:hypothetical protein